MGGSALGLVGSSRGDFGNLRFRVGISGTAASLDLGRREDVIGFRTRQCRLQDYGIRILDLEKDLFELPDAGAFDFGRTDVLAD